MKFKLSSQLLRDRNYFAKMGELPQAIFPPFPKNAILHLSVLYLGSGFAISFQNMLNIQNIGYENQI